MHADGKRDIERETEREREYGNDEKSMLNHFEIERSTMQ